MNPIERTRTVSWEDPLRTASQGFALSGVDYLRAMMKGTLPNAPIAALMGLALEEVEEGRVVFGVDPGEHHYNPSGVVHGGLLATLLDSAMGCAVHSLLLPERGYTTLEIKVNYLRAIKGETGRVLGIGTVVHKGNQIATAEGRVVDQSGKLYAHGVTTCLLLAPRTP